ncbi:hypothetical protein [Streptomyces sp. NPDC049887]|uniref:hypothetical protein n=1 Tax=Streptomyces sp. NPDC049887 TaxID=3155654 RepID=UPI00343D6F43
MSDLNRGRELWRSRHQRPAVSEQDGSDGTSPEDHGYATAGLAEGHALWRRRKAGGTFALGPEPVAPDVTPGNDAA